MSLNNELFGLTPKEGGELIAACGCLLISGLGILILLGIAILVWKEALGL